MSKQKTHYFISCLALILSSCSVQQQLRTVKEILGPAGNGDPMTTIAMMDTVDRLKHPILNLKYQSVKKKYRARFIEDSEKKKAFSKNEVINDICSFYQAYWKSKMTAESANADSLLYDNIAHYLVDHQLTDLSFETLSATIVDDAELGRVITDQGFHCKFLLMNGMQDILIWKKQSNTRYFVELPTDSIEVSVVNIEDYVLKGMLNYASCDDVEIGGWASISDTSLFCNKDTYRVKSENFKVSYLKHESIHFVDLQRYPNLQSADLEYRAKLIELSYCTENTIYDRLYEFIVGASDETPENPHPYANYQLIHRLSMRFFSVDFEQDYSKWKAISVEEINTASLAIFEEGTLILDADPMLLTIF